MGNWDFVSVSLVPLGARAGPKDQGGKGRQNDEDALHRSKPPLACELLPRDSAVGGSLRLGCDRFACAVYGATISPYSPMRLSKTVAFRNAHAPRGARERPARSVASRHSGCHRRHGRASQRRSAR